MSNRLKVLLVVFAVALVVAVERFDRSTFTARGLSDAVLGVPPGRDPNPITVGVEPENPALTAEEPATREIGDLVHEALPVGLID